MTTDDTYECQVLVVGSGIAGMSFLETFDSLCPDAKIILTSMTPLLKTARVTERQGRGIEHLDIQEITISDKLDQGQQQEEGCHLSCLNSNNFTFLLDKVISIDSYAHVVTTKQRRTIRYQYLCVCSGGRPDLIKGDQDFILGIRDTLSVKTFSSRLRNSRKVIIVGNGGIATELVHELEDCHIIWVIKDKCISSTFFDAAAAKFLFESRLERQETHGHTEDKDSSLVCSDKESKSEEKQESDARYFDPTFVANSRRKGVLSRKYVVDETECQDGEGSALGPDWSFNTILKGSLKDKQLDIEYEAQVSEVLSKNAFLSKYANNGDYCSQVSDTDFPAVVRLSNGKVLTCDLVVSATGVIPNTQVFNDDKRFVISSQDGGILVNEEMETSVSDVFAAGDVCTVQWKHESQTWHQMRLWTQARQMGFYAAQVVASKFHPEINRQLFFNFETFTHVTYFFGFKVILLGLFNQQKLEGGCHVQIRVEEGKSFIKVILKDGKVKGVTLIGDTDMEETFENLIISQMDVTAIQDHLLEATVDLDDYFD